MADPFERHIGALDSPLDNFATVTPSDTVDLPVRSRALWVGGGGTVVLRNAAGQSVAFANVAPGTLLPVRATRVMDTGTTASGIVAGW